jgi:NAD+ synthase
LISATETAGLLDKIQSRLVLDPPAAVSRIAEFIRDQLRLSGCDGIVVGISGGVDSAVTAALCVRSVGSDKTRGVFMFEEKNRDALDAQHARLVTDQLGIQTHDFTIDPVLSGFTKFPVSITNRVAQGNLKARLRMASLYYLANSENLLVAGTGDRSEDLIGYFTKYGDGGVDFLPIAHLYKTQVKQLARFLGIPKEIVDKPSSPNLWDGHKATDELPLDYSELDKALVCLFELKIEPETAAKSLRIEKTKIREILSRFDASAHKRSYPPMIGGW